MYNIKIFSAVLLLVTTLSVIPISGCHNKAVPVSQAQQATDRAIELNRRATLVEKKEIFSRSDYLKLAQWNDNSKQLSESEMAFVLSFVKNERFITAEGITKGSICLPLLAEQRNIPIPLAGEYRNCAINATAAKDDAVYKSASLFKELGIAMIGRLGKREDAELIKPFLQDQDAHIQKEAKKVFSELSQ